MADERPFTKRPYAIYYYVGAALLFVLSGIGVYVWELKQHPDVTIDRNRPIRVLIVGNGILWMNDVAQVLRTMGSASNRKLDVVQIAKPEPYSLAGHWTDGEAPRLLKEQRWDFLVLQDALELPNRDAKEMLTSTRDFVNLARKNPSTKVILMMPWTDQQALKKQEVISAVTRTLADRLSLYIAPIGDVFVEAEKRFPALSAHAADKHNASEVGSWLAAYCLYAIITGTRPTLDIKSYTFNSGNPDVPRFAGGAGSGTGAPDDSGTSPPDDSGTPNAADSETGSQAGSGGTPVGSGTTGVGDSETGASRIIDITDSIRREVEQLAWNKVTSLNSAYRLGPAPVVVPQK